MRTIGNIIWLIFGGIAIAVEYAIASLLLMLTIVGIPFGLQTLKMGMLALWPFGSEVAYRGGSSGCLHTIMNLIWLLIGGFWICLSHVVMGIIFSITIIGLPFGLQHFKLATLALTPFGREVISK